MIQIYYKISIIACNMRKNKNDTSDKTIYLINLNRWNNIF